MEARQKGKTQKYYDKNPSARAKKKAYDKSYGKKKKNKDKRVELNRINRQAGTYGNGDGKDYDHAVGRFVSAKTNRGRNSTNGGTKGDIRARK